MLQVIQNCGNGALEVVEVPAPRPGPGQMLVRTAASVVSSGTERHLVEMAEKTLLGKALARPDLVRRVIEKARTDGIVETIQQVQQRLDSPVALGYSAAGTVLEMGAGLTGFHVGDRVACGGQAVAVHAELLTVPPTLAVPVPANVSFEQASFAMIGAIPLHAVRLARTAPGEWVAVIGLGLLGLIAVQILRHAGCRVIAVDICPEKFALAAAFGAEAAIDSRQADAHAQIEALTHGHGVDAVLIAAATTSNGPFELAAKACRVRGRIVALGLVGLEVPRHLFFEKELELVVSRSSGPGLYDRAHEVHGRDYPYPYVRWTHGRNMAEFLRLVQSGAVRLDELITHRFPVKRALEAYDVLLKGGGAAAPPIGIVLQYEARDPQPATVVRLPRKERRQAAAGQVGVGLIGAGLFARTTLLPELRRIPGVRLVGVATASGASALHTARTFGFEFATADAQRLLDDPAVQTVIIATRHDSHAQLTAAALRAGKDVFVEKPLALTRDELDLVAEAWRAGSGRLMVGFNRRHSGHTAAACRFLASATGPALVHCRINAGDIVRGSWVTDPDAGGDRIRGEACHFVDLAQCLVGSRPLAAEAVGLPPTRAEDPCEDVAALLTFEDGSVCNLVYTARGHRSLAKERVEIFRGGRVVVLDNFRATRFYGPGAPRAYRTWRLDRGYRGELTAWFSALRSAGVAPVEFDTYVASTLATLALAEALQTGRRVAVDQALLARLTANA